MTCGIVYNRKIYWEGQWKRKNYPFALNMVPILKEYDNKGEIGRDVIELGCSFNPASNWLDQSKHKRILLDISSYVHRLSDLPDNPIPIECDLCDFQKTSQNYRIYKKALQNTRIIQFNAVIAADNIINYIPWKQVFRILDTDIKKNGLVFVCFGIDIGRRGAFHPHIPRSTTDVIQFFTNDLGYETMDACGCNECFGLVMQKK